MSLSFDLQAQRGTFSLVAAAQDIDGIVGVVGRSGAGKTTLLHSLAGLTDARGAITLAGLRRDTVPAHARKIGVVFQEPRLFPHLDVADNLAFAGAPADSRLVEALQLGRLLSRRVQTLSGGEARRVALARTLASKPEALLLDEPLTGVDPELRADLLRQIGQVVADQGLPTLWISHRSEDVLAVAERLLVMDRGRIVADGDPASLLLGTAGDVVRSLRVDNVLDVTLTGEAAVTWGSHPLVVPPRPAQATRLLLSPKDVVLATVDPGVTSIRNRVPGTVTARTTEGGRCRVSIDVHGAPLIADVTEAAARELQLTNGGPVTVLFKTSALRWAGA